MLRFLLLIVTVGALGGVECPGTWENRTPPPFTGQVIDAVALADGRVLVVGNHGARAASAVYAPASDSWSAIVDIPLLPIPDLHEGMDPNRDPAQPPDTLLVTPDHLTLMSDGSVVGISGSWRYWVHARDENGNVIGGVEGVITAALHWSEDGWSLGGTVWDSRRNYASARLGADRLVAVGGSNFRDGTPEGRSSIYDVPSRTWSTTDVNFVNSAGDAVARLRMQATRLADGRVLASGGQEWQGSPVYSETFIIGTDGSWTPSGAMTVGRASHITALLPDGRVLAAGGENASGGLNSAEIFDPSTGTWSAIQAAPASVRHSAILSDGRVLALAGDGGAAVFRPASATWCSTGQAPSGVVDLVAMPGGAVAFTADGTYQFTFDAEEPPMQSLTSLDITEARWGISVEADTVTVGGAAATAVGGRWEATTTLPGAQDNPVIIEWKVGPVTRSATANANEVIVPLGGG